MIFHIKVPEDSRGEKHILIYFLWIYETLWNYVRNDLFKQRSVGASTFSRLKNSFLFIQLKIDIRFLICSKRKPISPSQRNFTQNTNIFQPHQLKITETFAQSQYLPIFQLVHQATINVKTIRPVPVSWVFFVKFASHECMSTNEHSSVYTNLVAASGCFQSFLILNFYLQSLNMISESILTSLFNVLSLIYGCESKPQ